MAVSTAIVVGATVAKGAVDAHEARKTRKSAEEQAAAEREQLAQLANVEEPVIPDADDESVKTARRRSISAQLRRRGRDSTILTGDTTSDTLGG